MDSNNILSIKRILFFISLIIIPSYFMISCGDNNSPVQDNPPHFKTGNSLIADAGPDLTVYAGSFTSIDLSGSTLFNTKDYTFAAYTGDPANQPGAYIYDDFPEIFAGFINPGTYKYYVKVVQNDVESPPDTINITVLPRKNTLIPDINFEFVIRLSNNFYQGEITPEYLEKIEQIYIQDEAGDIKSLDGIERCKNLKYLTIDNDNLTDISNISLVTSLEYLYIHSFKHFTDIEFIKPLFNLKYLALAQLGNGDFSPIEKLFGLKHLRLYFEIPTGQPFRNLINLETFSVDRIQDGDLSFMENMTKMKSIYCKYESGIEDISPLHNMTQLEELSLNSNKIYNINVLKNCLKLRKMYLGANIIHDITVLKNLTALRVISLGSNKIHDIKPLVDNSGIDDAIEIDIRNNPLDSLSVNIYLPYLKSKGYIYRFVKTVLIL